MRSVFGLMIQVEMHGCGQNQRRGGDSVEIALALGW